MQLRKLAFFTGAFVFLALFLITFGIWVSACLHRNGLWLVNTHSDGAFHVDESLSLAWGDAVIIGAFDRYSVATSTAKKASEWVSRDLAKHPNTLSRLNLTTGPIRDLHSTGYLKLFAGSYRTIENAPENYQTSIRFMIPAWLPPLINAVPFSVWLVLSRRIKRRKKVGYCTTCGYDLRASPVQCPECGTFAPTLSLIGPAKRPASAEAHRVGRKVLAGVSAAALIAPVVIWLWWVVPSLRLQHKCLNYAASANKVVYDEDAIAGEELLKSDTNYTRYIDYGPASHPPLYFWTSPYIKPLLHYKYPRITTFLHSRSSPHGTVRLILVEMWISGVVDEDEQLPMLEFECRVYQPATFTKTPTFLSLSSLQIPRDNDQGPDGDGLLPPASISKARVFAGQPDSDDNSHFTIPLEINGHPTMLDGWLQDDDIVRLSVRGAALRSGGKLWYFDQSWGPLQKPWDN